MTKDQLEAYLRLRIDEEGECWIWRQRIDRNGVPMANFGGGPGNVRRRIWSLWHPDEEMGKRVASTSCGVRGCVNPEHVIAMPLKMAQRAAAKRGAYSQPEAIAARTRAMQKLSPLHANLALIRELFQQDVPSKEIAARIGCSPSAIRRVRAGDSHRPVVAGASVFAWRGNINL